MKLVELHDIDSPEDGEERDLAFQAFGSEYICRILGNPFFATDEILETCLCCESDMHYVASVCSEDYHSEFLVHDKFSFLIEESFLYFYYCKECLVIKTVMQKST
ncbi:hypothetical protein [Paenibacillus violae]|uniref:hypothetical protein n=1 Tax=Paenibacillus violae TaxID=3077234 RepID=UPI0028FC0F07|nr:hypothetical protein [Paenibacillus sp. PFR10]